MLNSRAERNVQYRVLYLGRHGEGFHNVAESWYGTEAWDVRFISCLFNFSRL